MCGFSPRDVINFSGINQNGADAIINNEVARFYKTG